MTDDRQVLDAITRAGGQGVADVDLPGAAGLSGRRLWRAVNRLSAAGEIMRGSSQRWFRCGAKRWGRG